MIRLRVELHTHESAVCRLAVQWDYTLECKITGKHCAAALVSCTKHENWISTACHHAKVLYYPGGQSVLLQFTFLLRLLSNIPVQRW